MRVDDIKNITVFGPGMMGSGIAQVFAGCEDLNVTIFIREKFEYEGLDKIIEGVLSRIKTTEDFEKAIKNADFIIECIPENMEMKQNLFSRVEKYCKKNAILATNTSVMSITEIAQKTNNKARVVGTHFWNPPYLIPLVEVVKSDYTSDEVFDTTYNLLKKVNKKPVKVNKDVPGFLANRLQHALWREAISIVENGIADAATVDEAVKYGFGLRLPYLGPMENADMVGLDLTYSIHDLSLIHI